jgi:hypothetical protein
LPSLSCDYVIYTQKWILNQNFCKCHNVPPEQQWKYEMNISPILRWLYFQLALRWSLYTDFHRTCVHPNSQKQCDGNLLFCILPTLVIFLTFYESCSNRLRWYHPGYCITSLSWFFLFEMMSQNSIIFLNSWGRGHNGEWWRGRYDTL